MEYDKSKFKIWTWKNPVMLPWIINPGLVINELILGQRVPKIMLIEKNSSKSLQEKTKIPCPHMYVFMTLLFPVIYGESITLKKALSGILIWTIGGFGYTMKLINGKKQVKH